MSQSQGALVAQNFLVGNLFIALFVSTVAFCAIIITLPRYRLKLAHLPH
jgi:hypothetical protein